MREPGLRRVAIAGAAGRMGRSLIAAFGRNGGPLTLTVAALRPGDPRLAGNAPPELPAGVRLTGDLEGAAGEFDVLIDFSTPEAGLAHLDICRRRGKALVLGTTGFSADGEAAVRAVRDIPLVFAPNMSVGVNLCLVLLRQAARALGGEMDIEIIEAHHRGKKDAPSGTALAMGEVIAGALGRDARKPGPGAVGFSVIRAGDIAGDHTVLFAGEGERLEISHRAAGRAAFARGALRAADWAARRPPGVYSMLDVLGLEGAGRRPGGGGNEGR